MAATVGVIHNPASGRGRGAKQWPAIEAMLRAALGDRLVATPATSGRGSAAAIAAKLVSEGVQVVGAAGGDGTVNEVLQGVLGTGADLAVVPLGTGNDFARMLGIGNDHSKAVDAIREGRTVTIDVGRWTQASATGHFINAAGCGFDAAVAEKINSGYRWLGGTSAYVAAVLGTLASYRAVGLTIEVDGEEIAARAMLCAMANAQAYGGGMKIAPSASLQDGFLDLVLVEEIGRGEFLKTFPKVFKGTHIEHPKVTHRQFKRLTIRSTPQGPFLVDGELVAAEPVTVEVVPGAIRVVVPPGSLP
ncbi:MAG: diacylglycerol kinase family lipid kinase [Armatimonadetes bacterium]|nr:diacylglycerol kinase family lipid kinase [Armatimonadota bacterium]